MNSKLFIICMLIPSYISGRIADMWIKNIADGKMSKYVWIICIAMWSINSVPYYFCLKYNEFNKTEVIGIAISLISALAVSWFAFHESIFTPRRMIAFLLAFIALVVYR